MVFRSVWQRSFFVTLVFVTLAASLFWLESFRVYRADMRVLIIGKVPTVAIDQVVENFSELTKNLSFYERLLEENDLIDDDFEGYSKDQRKALWNETVQVIRSDKSGVLLVSAKQDTPEKATRLAQQTVRTLFATGAFYYNIKTDIDMRVVDEPIVTTEVSNPLAYAAVSFGSAFGVTAFFFSLLALTPRFFGKRKEAVVSEFPLGTSVPFIDPQKFIPARPQALSFESTHETQMIQEQLTPEIVKGERMLPGMDAEELPFQFEEDFPENDEDGELEASVAFGGTSEEIFKKMDEKTVEAEPEETKQREPTIEEYKRRLNELLSGGK